MKQDGGESDAPRDLANELFMAKLKAEDTKDSSLNASLESLEHDDNDGGDADCDLGSGGDMQ